MNTKVLLATVAVTVFYFFAGWVIFGMALTGVYAERMTPYEGLLNEIPSLVPLVLMNLTWAFLIVMLTYKLGSDTLQGGFMTGLWVGFLVVASYNLSMAAFYNLMSPQLLIIDTLAATLMIAAGGAIGGLILGLSSKE